MSVMKPKGRRHAHTFLNSKKENNRMPTICSQLGRWDNPVVQEGASLSIAFAVVRECGRTMEDYVSQVNNESESKYLSLASG
jgi:hypothetical protein